MEKITAKEIFATLGNHILLVHLVMLESQPNLNKDDAGVSSSSDASCLNMEPGWKISSVLWRAGTGSC